MKSVTYVIFHREEAQKAILSGFSRDCWEPMYKSLGHPLHVFPNSFKILDFSDEVSAGPDISS
ncbi:MAG: hypothetical protein CMB80_31245 [Flammeovirgaceae bacterium]|nr:hypothetical protein [Flammeovirgaceae bacterium]